MNGHIKRMKKQRGFGFIRSSESTTEYFFHADDCLNKDFQEMNEGDKVSFIANDSNARGPRAQNVVKL